MAARAVAELERDQALERAYLAEQARDEAIEQSVDQLSAAHREFRDVLRRKESEIA